MLFPSSDDKPSVITVKQSPLECPVSASIFLLRLGASHPGPLPSSMPCGPQSSGAERPRQSLSARWILDDQQVSASQMVVAARRR